MEKTLLRYDQRLRQRGELLTEAEKVIREKCSSDVATLYSKAKSVLDEKHERELVDRELQELDRRIQAMVEERQRQDVEIMRRRVRFPVDVRFFAKVDSGAAKADADKSDLQRSNSFHRPPGVCKFISVSEMFYLRV